MSTDQQTEYRFEQVVKVVTDDWDSDHGDEWRVHYVLYETVTDDGAECFDLYEDDGEGNGTQIARGFNKSRMVSLTLRLGAWVEWTDTSVAA